MGFSVGGGGRLLSLYGGQNLDTDTHKDAGERWFYVQMKGVGGGWACVSGGAGQRLTVTLSVV